jgi:hypothetical protein
MDESAHGFSRKVLDRAFTLELSDADVSLWAPADPAAEAPAPHPWPMRAWHPRAVALGGLTGLAADDRARVQRAVDALGAVNPHLAPAGLQAGYRTRDEMALFVLHAAELSAAFADRAGAPVDPLDLALHMKILPRVAGGSAPCAARSWGSWVGPTRAAPSAPTRTPAPPGRLGRRGPPRRPPRRPLPRTAARLCLMWSGWWARGSPRSGREEGERGTGNGEWRVFARLLPHPLPAP